MIALSFVPVWTVILGVGIFLYVLLDGFDLGVGMLYGFMPDTRSRNILMNAIAPIWDGNETWLVLGGLALLAAFPLAFAIIIPALFFRSYSCSWHWCFEVLLSSSASAKRRGGPSGIRASSVVR